MWTKSSHGWLSLAAIGGAAGFCVARLRKKSHAAKDGAVGAHAWIVSLEQARQEADWTKNAVNYKGGSKGG